MPVTADGFDRRVRQALQALYQCNQPATAPAPAHILPVHVVKAASRRSLFHFLVGQGLRKTAGGRMLLPLLGLLYNGLCCCWGGLRTAAPSEATVCRLPQLEAGNCLSRQRGAPRQASWRRPLFRPPPLPRLLPCCLQRHAPAQSQLQASVPFTVQADVLSRSAQHGNCAASSEPTQLGY